VPNGCVPSIVTGGVLYAANVVMKDPDRRTPNAANVSCAGGPTCGN
jgi:hypothetical protein